MNFSPKSLSHRNTLHASLKTHYLWVVSLIGATLFLQSCNSRSNSPQIKILWAEWRPSDALSELGKVYETNTGIPVKMVKKSWDGAFGDATFSEFRNRDDNYDIIIGDSQWMGLGVVGKHYVELTNWMKTNVDTSNMEPAALKWYCEYPKGAHRYYAVPCEADAMAWAYRKDLFEDPDHKTGFRNWLVSKGVAPVFPLAPPETWEQLRLIALYFKESMPGMAGLVMPTARGYDKATMTFQAIMWAFGGEYGNYATNQVTIDSPNTVEALRFFTSLMDATSPGGRNMGYSEVNAEFLAGRSAMACNFMAFFPVLASVSDNPDFHDKIGYFNAPGHVDKKGVFRRAATLGGQGMSINAHISVERQARAKAFLKWFSETSTQRMWADKGGFTSNKTVLASEAFKSATPYNPIFEEAFRLMKDFWSLPEYDDLMKVCQREFCAVFQDGADAAVAVKHVQADHEAILRKAGRLP